LVRSRVKLSFIETVLTLTREIKFTSQEVKKTSWESILKNKEIKLLGINLPYVMRLGWFCRLKKIKLMGYFLIIAGLVLLIVLAAISRSWGFLIALAILLVAVQLVLWNYCKSRKRLVFYRVYPRNSKIIEIKTKEGFTLVLGE